MWIEIDIFPILSLLNIEHGLSVYLFISSLIYFFIVVQFSSHRVCTYMLDLFLIILFFECLPNQSHNLILHSIVID